MLRTAMSQMRNEFEFISEMPRVYNFFFSFFLWSWRHSQAV